MLKELKAKITADASRFKTACQESIAKTRDLAKAIAAKAGNARASERAVQQALQETEKQLDKTTAAAKRAKAAGGGAGSTAGASGGSARSVFKGILGAKVTIAAIQKVTGYVSDLVKGMDEIGKGAANLGISTEYCQKLQFAANRTGTGFDKVFQGFSKIKKLAADAAAGNAQATQTFHDLGISVAEIKTLSPEALFDRATSALRNMEDPLQRNAISARLFGEEFSKLNNFLKDYQALGDEAEAKGLIIKDEEIKAAEALGDSITNLQKSLTALSASSGLVSFLQRVADGISEIDKGLRALKNNPAAMAEAGITAKDNRSTLQKWFYTAQNYNVTGNAFLYAKKWLTGDKAPVTGFGDYLWKKMHPGQEMVEYTTQPTRQQDITDHRQKLQQAQEEKAAAQAKAEENRRALEREKSEADNKKLQQGLQQLQASRQQPGTSTASSRATQMLRSDEGIAQLQRMGKDYYMQATGELLPPGAASQLQYIKTGLQLFEQMEQAQRKRAETHKRISDAIAHQNASDEQRERMQLKRELDEFAAAGASKEALARLYATRIADITRRAAERRHAQELAQLRAENNRLIQQIDQRNQAMQKRLDRFRFVLSEDFDPNESAAARRRRVKRQKLDESIADKAMRQERGENVHYTRAERRRIADYERIRRRMNRNDERIAALREEPVIRQDRRQQRRQQAAMRQLPAHRPAHPSVPAMPTRPASPRQQPRQPRLIATAPTIAKPETVSVPVERPEPVKTPLPPVNAPAVIGATGAMTQTSYMPILAQIASAVYKLGEQTYVVRGGR